jgi:hypothetical protein
VKLLGNNKDSGAPIELSHKEKVPISALRYTPD